MARLGRSCLVALLGAWCGGCPTPPDILDSGLIEETPDGEQIVFDPFVGVQLIQRTQTEPRPLSIHVVIIDPLAPGVSFTATPGNGEAEGETNRQTASQFLVSQGAALAVNAHFFAPWPALPSAPADLLGLSIADGELVSPFEPGASVGFAITAQGEAAIVRPADPEGGGFATDPPMMVDDAVGGLEQILTNGEITADWEALHPRTAIGVTNDGFVVLAVVDGRQDGVSEGMTTPELAELMAGFGVMDALNLDGGGSTTLVVRDGEEPVVVNVPVGYQVPGTERHCGSFLGVHATES